MVYLVHVPSTIKERKIITYRMINTRQDSTFNNINCKCTTFTVRKDFTHIIASGHASLLASLG